MNKLINYIYVFPLKAFNVSAYTRILKQPIINGNAYALIYYEICTVYASGIINLLTQIYDGYDMRII